MDESLLLLLLLQHRYTALLFLFANFFIVSKQSLMFQKDILVRHQDRFLIRNYLRNEISARTIVEDRSFQYIAIYKR